MYTWHRQSCKVLAKAPFKRGIKRNALIEMQSGLQIVVPWRSIRKAHRVNEIKVHKSREATWDLPERYPSQPPVSHRSLMHH